MLCAAFHITEFGSTFNGQGEHFSPTDILDPNLSVNKSSWDVCKSKLWPPFQIPFPEVFMPVMPSFCDPVMPTFRQRKEDMRTLAGTHKCGIMETQQKLERNIGYTSRLRIRHDMEINE